MIVRRAIALIAVLGAIAVCADAVRHASFNSGAVANGAAPHYIVQCEGIEFRRDATIATVRIVDDSSFPQFHAFRQAISQPPAPYIYLPPSFGTSEGWLRFVHYEDLPDLVVDPKPSNRIHEAVVKIAFDPINKFRSNPLNIDKVFLRVPGLPAFPVYRRVPLSQSQGTITAVHDALVRVIPPLTAEVLLVVGGFLFCGIALDSYRQWDMLIWEWKFKQLQTKGLLVKTAKRTAKIEDGTVLVLGTRTFFLKNTRTPMLTSAPVNGALKCYHCDSAFSARQYSWQSRCLVHSRFSGKTCRSCVASHVLRSQDPPITHPMLAPE